MHFHGTIQKTHTSPLYNTVVIDPALRGTGTDWRASQWINAGLNPLSREDVRKKIEPPVLLSSKKFLEESDLEKEPHILFLCGDMRFDPSTVDAMRRQIMQGMTVVIFPDNYADPASFNALCYVDGKGISPGKLGKLVKVEKDDDSPTISAEHLDHPLASIYKSEDYAQMLSEIKMKFYYQLEFADEGKKEGGEGEAKRSKSNKTQIVFRLGNGLPFLLEKSIGKGRVYLFASSIRREWSTWAILPSAPIFFNDVLNDSLNARGLTQNLLFGDAFEHELGQEYSGQGTLLIERPDETEVDGRIIDLKTADGETQTFAKFNYTEMTGFYVARAVIGEDENTKLIPFSVNIHERESHLEPLSQEALLESLGDIKDKINIIKAGGDIESKSDVLLNQAELWLWVFTLLMILVLVEMILSRKYSPRKGAGEQVAKPGGLG